MQRTLFRMQLDAAFARALRSGDSRAVASTGLAPDDLALLTAAEPAGVSADPGGQRRTQVLGNVAAEFLLSTWVAVQGGADPDFVEAFAAASELHACVAEDGRIPLAFARHAEQRASRAGNALLTALVALEAAMARARREHRGCPAVRRGEVVLSERVRVVTVPAGTVEAASGLRAALDAGRVPTPPDPPDPLARESVLLLAADTPPYRVAEVAVEVLGELAAAVLRLAERPVGPPERARFCERHELEADELDGFLGTLVEEGVLVAG